MSDALSIISFITVVSDSTFVFALIMERSGSESRLASTEKRCKAAIPRWNLIAAEQGIPKRKYNFPTLVEEEGKPTKQGNRLMKYFAEFLDGMSGMT